MSNLDDIGHDLSELHTLARELEQARAELESAHSEIMRLRAKGEVSVLTVTVTPTEMALLIEACESQALMDIRPGEGIWVNLADKLRANTPKEAEE